MYLDQTFETFSQFFLKYWWNIVFYFCHCSTYLFSVQHINSNPQRQHQHTQNWSEPLKSHLETSLDVIMECHLWNATNATRNDRKNLSFVWLMHKKLCSFVAIYMTKNLNGMTGIQLSTVCNSYIILGTALPRGRQSSIKQFLAQSGN